MVGVHVCCDLSTRLRDLALHYIEFKKKTYRIKGFGLDVEAFHADGMSNPYSIEVVKVVKFFVKLRP